MADPAPTPGGGLRRQVRSWWNGTGPLPTTRVGTELCCVIAFVGLRITDLVQLAVAVPTGLENTTNATLDGCLLAVYFAESALITIIVCRRRRYLDSRLAWIDTALALVVLACTPMFTTHADRVGTWTAWGFAISVGAAFAAGIGFVHRWETLAAATALAAGYVLVSLPATGPHTAASTVWSNAVAYFGFAIFTRAFVSYLRRLGTDADDSRARATQSARQAEASRHRLLLHDQATVLRLLSEPELDPGLAELVRRQAAVGSARIRSFLSESDAAQPNVDSDKVTNDVLLATLVREVARDFPDLVIEFALDLADGVAVVPKTGAAIAQALETTLHNVRTHAGPGAAVVIHGDAGSEGRWELTIRDDGQGFDPTTVELGFGLREQVVANLARNGVSAAIASRRGDGTAITFLSIIGAAT